MDEQRTETVREEEVDRGGVHEKRQVVSSDTQVDGRVIVARVIWWVAGVIIALLALRVVMMLLGANDNSPFVSFIYALSGVFAWPFYGIFPQPEYGVSALDSASLVGIVVYTLVAWGLAKLMTLTATRTDV